MNKWLPIIVVGLIVLGLRLPTCIMRSRAERTIAELEASGKLDAILHHGSGAGATAQGPRTAESDSAHDVGSPNGRPEPVQFNWASQNRDADTPKEGERYVNPELGFSIIFPRGWTVKDAVSTGDIVIKAISRGDNHELAALNNYAYELDGLADYGTMSAEDYFNTHYGNAGSLLDSGVAHIAGQRSSWMKWRPAPIAGLLT